MTGDAALDRIDQLNPTRLQFAEDRYQEARHQFEQARARWLAEGGPTAERDVVRASNRLQDAEDYLNVEKQAAAARANELPF